MDINNSERLDSAKEKSAGSITAPYALFINIPAYRNKDGHFCFGDLWIKDLVGHINYISNLTLVCPVSDQEPPSGYFPIASFPGMEGIKIEVLPAVDSLFSALIQLPRMLVSFSRICSRSVILHIGVAGWPIPYGWVVAGLFKLFYRQKLLLVVVESAPWRITGLSGENLKQKIKAGIFEGMAKWCVNLADVSVFTQDQYKTSLLRKGQQIGRTIHASWIDDEMIPAQNEVKKLWAEKLNLQGKELKLIFVGRLVRDKGILNLFEALRMLPEDAVVSLDILGTGALLESCENMANSMNSKESTIKVRMLGTMPYGQKYFNLLRDYHAIVVPTISDEQPRVIYDAFSQALPVIASDTHGNRDCVLEGENGWLFSPGNSAELAEAILDAYRDRQKLRGLGLAALSTAKRMTHQEMHEQRRLLLIGHPKLNLSHL